MRDRITLEQAEQMIALQRAEIIRLHAIVDRLRQRPDAGDLSRRLLGAQREVWRQRGRAELWRTRATR